MIIGVLSIGGFGEAFELATKGERLQFEYVIKFIENKQISIVNFQF